MTGQERDLKRGVYVRLPTEQSFFARQNTFGEVPKSAPPKRGRNRRATDQTVCAGSGAMVKFAPRGQESTFAPKRHKKWAGRTLFWLSANEIWTFFWFFSGKASLAARDAFKTATFPIYCDFLLASPIFSSAKPDYWPTPENDAKVVLSLISQNPRFFELFLGFRAGTPKSWGYPQILSSSQIWHPQILRRTSALDLRSWGGPQVWTSAPEEDLSSWGYLSDPRRSDSDPELTDSDLAQILSSRTQIWIYGQPPTWYLLACISR